MFLACDTVYRFIGMYHFAFVQLLVALEAFICIHFDCNWFCSRKQTDFVHTIEITDKIYHSSTKNYKK